MLSLPAELLREIAIVPQSARALSYTCAGLAAACRGMFWCKRADTFRGPDLITVKGKYFNRRFLLGENTITQDSRFISWEGGNLVRKRPTIADDIFNFVFADVNGIVYIAPRSAADVLVELVGCVGIVAIYEPIFTYHGRGRDVPGRYITNEPNGAKCYLIRGRVIRTDIAVENISGEVLGLICLSRGQSQ